jgi:hypothetical protein
MQLTDNIADRANQHEQVILIASTILVGAADGHDAIPNESNGTLNQMTNQPHPTRKPFQTVVIPSWRFIQLVE